MHIARTQSPSASPAALNAWQRRQRAAWLDYLRATRESDRAEYELIEQNAWEQLRRRLNRNDELLAATSH